MITLIKWVLWVLINILPDSPFQSMASQLSIDSGMLQYLNWFLPLDIIGNIMLAWLDCMLLYLVFKIVWKLIVGFLFSKLKSVFSLFSLGS